MTSRPAAQTTIPLAQRLPTRRGLLVAVQWRYSTRVHMALILLGSMAVALLVTRGLLAAGTHAMVWRYLPALAAAYAAFFVGVWIWLHLSVYGRHLRARRDAERGSNDASFDLPQAEGLPWPSGSAQGTPAAHGDGFAGGGGSFDGGGASAGWADAESLSASSPLDALGSSGGTEVGAFDLGGDEGGVLLVVAMGLVLLALVVLFGAVGLVVWEAPVILTEVVFEVLLASSLVKGMRGVTSRDWGIALLRHTWKTFAFVCALVLAFAMIASVVAPQARTAADVVRTVTAKK